MKIAMGSDHGALNLKKAVKDHLEAKGHEVVDYGTHTVDSCDYPVYGKIAAEAVASGECDCGIIMCGTGIGISLAANKVKGIRCAVVSDCFSAEMTKLHNNANMISLGERVVGTGLALKIVDAYMDAEFEGGRHERRVNLITEIENEYNK